MGGSDVTMLEGVWDRGILGASREWWPSPGCMLKVFGRRSGGKDAVGGFG